MRFEEYINEIFTTPVKVKLKQDAVDAYSATFKVGDAKFHFEADSPSPGLYDWDIDFFFVKGVTGMWDIQAMKDPKDALKVFSTVVDLTKQFIKMEKPEEIKFSSNRDEPHKVRLYDKFAKWMERLGYKLFERKTSKSYVNWEFERSKS